MFVEDRLQFAFPNIVIFLLHCIDWLPVTCAGNTLASCVTISAVTAGGMI